MFLAPVLTVIRASGFGLAFGAATLALGSCSVLPDESDRFRIQRVEEAVLPMARIALEAEQTETAKRLYRRLLEVDPGSVSARMGLGDIAVAGRDSAQAARWYAAAVALARRADERHPALLAHGRAALSVGDLEAARKSFSRLTSGREGAPTLSVAWGLNGLGLVALLEGDIRGAIRLMEQAVLLAPEEPMLADNLTRALDLSAGMAPEGASADRIQDMAVASAAASSPDVRMPEPAGDAAAKVEKDVAEDRTPNRPMPDAIAVTDTGRRQERSAESRRGADVRRIDRSELRPFAVRVGGEYYVRIGAHTSRAEARDVAAELRGVTAERVDVVEFGMGDGRDEVRLYRILVGPIASSAGLVELVAVLEELGYGTARVPPSVASRSGPAATPARGASGQRNAGPELVEVPLDAAGDETDAMRTTALQAPAPEEESRDPTGTVAARTERESAPAADGEKRDAARTGVSSTEVESAPALEGESRDLTGTGLVRTERETASAADGERRAATGTGVSSTEVESVPALEGESRDLTGTEAARTELESAPAANGERPDATSVEEAPSPESADSRPTEGDAGSTRSDPAVAPLSGNGSVGPQAAPQFLQVGAYTVRSAAEALAAEVGGVARAPVRVVEAELASGETMYRVQVGPIASRRRMAELGEMLISGGYGTVRVLSEPAPTDSPPGDVLPYPSPPSGSSERRVKAFIVREDGERFLQMGAYAFRATADTLASQLRLVTSEPAFAAEALNDDGNSLYRVRIGPIESDAALATLLRALRSSYGNGWVLPSMDADPARAAFVVHEDSERFLQMGAYAVRSAADALASELRGQIDGEIRVTEISRGSDDPVYRVRVGPIATDNSLMALVEAVESLGYMVD